MIIEVYYKDNCIRCEKFAKEIEPFYEEDGIGVMYQHYTTNKNKWYRRVFPLIYIRDGDNVEPYKGRLTYKDLKEYLNTISNEKGLRNNRQS